MGSSPVITLPHNFGVLLRLTISDKNVVIILSYYNH